MMEYTSICLVARPNIPEAMVEGMRARMAGLFPHSEVKAERPTNKKALQEIFSRTEGLMVICGGDGTIRDAVVNIIPHRHILGILPFGKGNDFVRSLGIPLNLNRAITLLKTGVESRIDVGKAGEHLFINSFGFGIDSEVIKARSRYPNLPGGYLALFFTTFLHLKPFFLRFRVNHRLVEGDYYWFLILNGGYIGGGIPVHPQASPRDGRFHLLLLKKGPRYQILTNLPRALKGQHLSHPLVQTMVAEEIQVEQPPTVDAALDGDLFGCQCPLTIRCLPGYLRVVTPG